jgi:hypothetical protein
MANIHRDQACGVCRGYYAKSEGKCGNQAYMGIDKISGGHSVSLQQFSLWPEALWLRHCDVIVPKENLTQRRNGATHKRLFVAPLRRCVKPFVAVLVLRCPNFQGFTPN